MPGLARLGVDCGRERARLCPAVGEILHGSDIGGLRVYDPARLPRLIGSVQNPGRNLAALQKLGVQTICHAAAYKHVPLVEHNVVEGLRNNVFGTKTVGNAAIATGVEACILVSSDKAMRPTIIMGAPKRLAELVCQAAADRQTRITFTMVRFGNALGSSGPVIPRFRAQVEQGGLVTVTHPDMGAPLKIVDLADRIVRLSGGLVAWSMAR